MHTRSRRLLGIVAIVSALTMLATGTALATGTLDQSNPGPETGPFDLGGSGRLAQTFVAGITGAIDTVQLNVWRDGLPGDLVVRVVGTNSLANPGIPDETDVLASQTVAEFDVGESTTNVLTVTFDTPASIQAGTRYALVLSIGTPDNGDALHHDFQWETTADAYGNGRACVWATYHFDCDTYSDRDFIFATYVTPPETADVAVALGGPGTVRSGSTNTWQVTVSNSGPMTARNVVLTVPVPAGTKFVSAIPTQGTCAAPARRTSPPTVTCSLGDISAAGSTLTTVTLKVSLSAKGGGIVTVARAYSTATNATPATTDPDLSNNVDSLGTTVTK